MELVGQACSLHTPVCLWSRQPFQHSGSSGGDLTRIGMIRMASSLVLFPLPVCCGCVLLVASKFLLPSPGKEALSAVHQVQNV